jgi:hypothetical protein
MTLHNTPAANAESALASITTQKDIVRETGFIDDIV